MENVRSYCDDILDVIHKFGEEYIYDPRTKIIDGKDLFVSVDNNINNDIAYSDDSDNRSNEACVNLGLTFAVGQHCEKLRVKYVDAIKSRLLGMDPKARMVYAEEILQRLYEIQLNHPIFHSKVFQKLVIPFFFSDVTEAFERYDINLWNILVNCQKKHGTFFCYWLKFLKHHYDTIGLQRCVYSESDILDGLPNASQCELSNVSQEELPNASQCGLSNVSQEELPNASQCGLSNVSQEELPNASQCGLSNVSQEELPNASQCELSNVSQEELPNASQEELSNVSDESTDNLSNIEDEFYKLFDSYDKGVVLELIKKLEEFNIVRERDYVCKYKNYLAKLMIFMKNQGILKYNRLVPVARIFYGYFNLVVRKTSIGENSVTERNIRVIENRGTMGLSTDEIEDFKLICGHFPK
ncbi:hypothetical protein NBH02_13815 [Parabacteroides sp. B2-Q-110]|jgi:hypothetical protein|uniref:hypothetical protein n=1 Tax=Parabacteroides sp. B2-Q-110 TaxID=2949661 RepID=UPI00203064EB|nr:hypothetical protein [Parabacteroides sp. B2-Q-110]MCM0671599.1 hypothetical protein [Parabacteroides sp. B2-Q-110]